MVSWGKNRNNIRIFADRKRIKQELEELEEVIARQGGLRS